MAVRDAVVIGCGTTGSEIAVKIYKNYQNYIRNTNDDPKAVQFLLIDTQDAVSGAEELLYNGDHLMIGLPQANRVLDANRRSDPFFRMWWPEDYTDIPNLYPGAGTVPINGRFAFWDQLGNPADQRSFYNAFYQKATVRPRTRDANGKLVKLLVFIIGTLSGGTGAGVFLDVAQIIKDMTALETEIHGVFLLDNIVNMRAEPHVHNQTSANAYGSLIGLNYWQTQKVTRDKRINLGDFMQKYGRTYPGRYSPFSVCWLLSQLNQGNRGMSEIEEYQQMASDAVSMMLFEEQAGNIGARLMDVLTNIHDETRTKSPQPRAFGSFAAYTLSYHPEKALKYLASELTIKSIDKVKAVPDNLTDLVEPTLNNFLVNNGLREVDADGDGAAMNEVTEQIKSLNNPEMILYPVMQTVIMHLRQEGTSTALFTELTKPSVNKDTVKSAFHTFYENVKTGLTGKLQNQKGVNYQEIIQSNRQLLYEKVIQKKEKREESKEDQSTGLHQLIGWLIKDEQYQVAGSIRLLEKLQANLPKHRESLEYELIGDRNRGVVGDKERQKTLEAALDLKLTALAKELSGRKKKQQEAIKIFENSWWKPWLSTALTVLVKTEAVAFYKALELEIEWLIEYLKKDVSEALDKLQSEHDLNTTSLFAQGNSEGIYRLEEDAIMRGDSLSQKYAAEMEKSLPITRQKTLGTLATELENFFGSADRNMDARRRVIKTLQSKIDEELAEEAEETFKEDVYGLSLWDAMTLGMENDPPKALRTYIEARITSIRARCQAYWKISPAFRAQGGGMVPQVLPLYSYDQGAKESFEQKHGITLDIASAAKGTVQGNLILGVRQTAYKTSSYELKILVCEAGVPLFYIDPVNGAKDEFEITRNSTNKPCITDKRYERLIERGLPTWDPNIADVIGRETAILLMAEHFRIIESPMLSKNKSPNGKYKYGDRLLKNTRYRAFEQLQPGGEYHNDLYPQIEAEVVAKEQNYTPQGWQDQHFACYQRLLDYLSRAPESDVKNLVRDQISQFESHLVTMFSFIDSEELRNTIKNGETKRRIKEVLYDEIDEQ